MEDPFRFFSTSLSRSRSTKEKDQEKGFPPFFSIIWRVLM